MITRYKFITPGHDPTEVTVFTIFNTYGAAVTVTEFFGDYTMDFSRVRLLHTTVPPFTRRTDSFHKAVDILDTFGFVFPTFEDYDVPTYDDAFYGEP